MRGEVGIYDAAVGEQGGLDWSWKDLVLLVFDMNKKYPQCGIADKEAIVFIKK